MENKRFKPLIDKLFCYIFIPTSALLLFFTVLLAFSEPKTLFWMVPIDVFVGYFLVSPLFGYVELKDDHVYIKYGFIMKKEIPYGKIRAVIKERKFYSESMMSLKNAFEHVNIKYNSFDVTTVSVVDNDTFMDELNKRIRDLK